MRPRIVDRDMGYRRIRKAVKELERRGADIAVGIQGTDATTKHAGADLTNVEVAAVHEFGSADGRIPERSFIRATLDAKGKEYRELGKKLTIGIIDGDLDRQRAAGILGEKVKAGVVATIRAGVEPPLAPSTIERKGSSKPLIDTGQLVNSITSRVL